MSTNTPDSEHRVPPVPAGYTGDLSQSTQSQPAPGPKNERSNRTESGPERDTSVPAPLTTTSILDEVANDPTRVIREEIRRSRHRAELPLFGVTLGISVLIWLYILTHPFLASEVAYSYDPIGILALFLDDNWLGVLVLVCGYLLFSYAYLYGYEIGNAVRVTEKNFPEIYEKSVEYAAMLGLKKVPEVYIMQENGALNAFSSWIVGRRYVQLNSELVDIAYLENNDLDSVLFVMAHEFGHIYLRHVPLWRSILLLWGEIIPVLGSTLSRSMEYSCDRVAQVLTGNQGVTTMTVLMAGRHLYSHVDLDDYVGETHRDRGVIAFLGYFVYNMLSSHPVMDLRINALLDPQQRSGSLFGKMLKIS